MKRKRARKAGIVLVATLLAVLAVYVSRGAAQRTPESQLIDEVAGALGGTTRVMGVRTLVIEGGGRQGDLAALMTAESPLVGWEVRFKRTYDLANGRMRTWQSNRSLFPARFDLQPAGGARTVNALDGDIAFNLPADGSMMGAWADSNPDGLSSIGSTWGITNPERPATMEAWPKSYPAAPPPPQRMFGQAAVARRLDCCSTP